ncbi:MAG: hypothetical protein AABZ63_03100, partial [Actinomycetota bacterium]
MPWRGPAKIAVDAADGWSIDNQRDEDPDENMVLLAKQGCGLLLKSAAVRPLAPASGRYNCHGLVFGTRRTNICGPNREVDVDELLCRDGYVLVPSSQPEVGDVVVYRNRGGG